MTTVQDPGPMTEVPEPDSAPPNLLEIAIDGGHFRSVTRIGYPRDTETLVSFRLERNYVVVPVALWMYPEHLSCRRDSELCRGIHILEQKVNGYWEFPDYAHGEAEPYSPNPRARISRGLAVLEFEEWQWSEVDEEGRPSASGEGFVAIFEKAFVTLDPARCLTLAEPDEDWDPEHYPNMVAGATARGILVALGSALAALDSDDAELVMILAQLADGPSS